MAIYKSALDLVGNTPQARNKSEEDEKHRNITERKSRGEQESNSGEGSHQNV